MISWGTNVQMHPMRLCRHLSDRATSFRDAGGLQAHPKMEIDCLPPPWFRWREGDSVADGGCVGDREPFSLMTAALGGGAGAGSKNSSSISLNFLEAKFAAGRLAI